MPLQLKESVCAPAENCWVGSAATCADSADAGSPTPGELSPLAPEPSAKIAPAASAASTSTIHEVRRAVMKVVSLRIVLVFHVVNY